MTNVIQPFHLLVIALAGWLNRHQQAVIDYLIEENGVLKEQLEGKRLRFTDEQRIRLTEDFRFSALPKRWMSVTAPVCAILSVLSGAHGHPTEYSRVRRAQRESNHIPITGTLSSVPGALRQSGRIHQTPGPTARSPRHRPAACTARWHPAGYSRNNYPYRHS